MMVLFIIFLDGKGRISINQNTQPRKNLTIFAFCILIMVVENGGGGDSDYFWCQNFG